MNDPVLRAIADFRIAFDLLYNEEKARLGILGSEPGPVEHGIEGAGESRTEWTASAGAASGLADPKEKRRTKVQIHSAERVAEHSPMVRPSPAAMTAEPGRAETSSDPRQRLDVLAKHLDRRAKQSRPTADQAAR